MLLVHLVSILIDFFKKSENKNKDDTYTRVLLCDSSEDKPQKKIYRRYNSFREKRNNSVFVKSNEELRID